MARTARQIRLLVVACVAAAAASAFAPAGARADVVSSPCPPSGGRLFCITISDTDGVSPSPSAGPASYMRQVVTVRNVDGRSLTHTSLTVSLADVTTGGSAPSTARLVELSSAPTPGICAVAPGGDVLCDAGRLSAGASFTATLVYTTSATDGVRATRATAKVSVDEHERDGTDPKDPNQEVRSVANDVAYETRPDFGSTFVPDAAAPIRVATSLSSLAFSTPGRESFFAEIQDYANDLSHCFAGVPCLAQTTRGDIGDTQGGLGPILWQRRITNVPKGVSATSIDSVHFYDPVSVTADPATNTFTSSESFVGIDGVRFSASGALPGGLRAGVDYVVVRAGGTTFAVATRKGGKPVDLTSAGEGVSAERIRVIGDAKAERWTSCTTPPPALPAIAATQVSKTVIDTCVWTSENGWMK